MLPLSPQYERYKAGGFLSFHEYETSLILGFDNEAEFGKFRESGDYDETCRELAHHRMLLMKKSPVSVALEPIELCPRSVTITMCGTTAEPKKRVSFFIFAKSSAGRQTPHFGQSNGSS